MKEIDGVQSEPFEAVQIDTPDEYSGAVIDSLNQRKGEMRNMEPTGTGTTRLDFLVPSRGLIGYSTEFMSLTRGYGIYNHTYEAYGPVVKNWNPGVVMEHLFQLTKAKPQHMQSWVLKIVERCSSILLMTFMKVWLLV